MDEKIIIFGLGGTYKNERKKNSSLFEGLNIVAYSDNNQTLWGTMVNGIYVVSPEELSQINYEKIVVISNYYKEICIQLIELGINENKIIHWDEYSIQHCHDYILYKSGYSKNSSKTIILISTTLEYNGGTIALINAAISLFDLNYDVTICGPGAEKDIVNYINSKGINVVIDPAVKYPNEKELEWITKYNYVIVNVFQMLEAACLISEHKKVLWWIHESGERYSDIYPIVRSIHYKTKVDNYSNILVCPVSKRAEDVFLGYYPKFRTKVMPFGLEDFFEGNTLQSSDKIRIGIIAAVKPLKNQLFVLKALSEYSEEIEIKLIGHLDTTEYANNVKAIAEKMSNVKFVERVSHKDICKIYNELDVVLCASLEETMSMTIVEGMMNMKICVTSDATGVSDFITDGVDGFIFKSNDEDSLRKKIQWIISNKNDLEDIRKNARSNYLSNFSLSKIGQRLEAILNEE